MSTGIRSRKLVLFALLGVSIIAFILTKSHRTTRQEVTLPWENLPALKTLKQAAAQRPNDPQAHYQLAMAYGMNKFYLEALDEFRTTIRLGLNKAEIHHHLGTCYLQLGRLREATKEFSTALEMEPDKLENYLALSKAYQQQGQLARALRVLRKAQKRVQLIKAGCARCEVGSKSASAKTPDDTLQAMESLAVAFAKLGDLASAMRLARHYVHLAPDLPAGHAILGRCYYALGQIGEALPHLKKAVQLASWNGELHHLYGMALLRSSLKDKEKLAFKEFEEAIRRSPTLGRAYYELGKLCYKQGRWQDAAKAFVRSVQFGYESVNSMRYAAQSFLKAGDKIEGTYRMGMYYLAVAKPEAALLEFRKLTKWASCCGAGYAHLADTYRAMRQTQKYLEHAKIAAKLRPDDPQSYLRLADAYLAARDPKGRAQALKKLATLKPEMADFAYRELATMAFGSGNFDRAERLFLKCIEMRPQEPDYWFSLARAYLARPGKSARLSKAIEALEKACALDDRNFRNAHWLGIAYQKAGRYEEAAAAFRRAINLAPGFGEAYMNLGQVYRKLGKTSDSREMLSLYRRYVRFTTRLSLLKTRAQADPNDPKVRMDLGEFYLNAGDYVKAFEEYARVAKLQPDNITAHEKLALIHALLARPEDQAKELAIVQRLRQRKRQL